MSHNYKREFPMTLKCADCGLKRYAGNMDDLRVKAYTLETELGQLEWVNEEPTCDTVKDAKNAPPPHNTAYFLISKPSPIFGGKKAGK